MFNPGANELDEFVNSYRDLNQEPPPHQSSPLFRSDAVRTPPPYSQGDLTLRPPSPHSLPLQGAGGEMGGGAGEGLHRGVLYDPTDNMKGGVASSATQSEDWKK